MRRRDFINNIAKGTGFIVAIPLMTVSCEEPIGDPVDEIEDGPDAAENLLKIDLTKEVNSNLNSSGGHLITNNIIIINNGDGFIALSSVCTHAGCQVNYNKSENNIPCNCHGSLFDIQGSVLNGPADAPLKKYPVTTEDDLVIVDLGS